ncbi:MAG TPA: terminase family protein [Stellaceae bacterium]|nr:terminase family protein [Stellaceae bacterium]
MDEPAIAAFARLADGEREAHIAALEREGALEVCYDWKLWARPSQLPPQGAWRIWLLLAGRGFGKTRSGAEFVREEVMRGAAKRVALVAPTAADARDVMVEGESGLLAIAPAKERPLYEPSKRRLTWPGGAMATLFSADEPERLRGPQFDLAWCDELAAWRYPMAWDMLMMGLRLGATPRVVATTTPKPVPLIRALLATPDCVVTRGSTKDNADNLAPAFLKAILAQYEGTRLGRQELEAELLEDVPGALWSRDSIERARVASAPALRRVVVAIDPAASSAAGADETGIVVAGLGEDGHGYVLDDHSGRLRPHDWAARAIAAFHAQRADRIVAEVNNGGEMVEATLRMLDASVPYKPVHASRGKMLRAEPVAALYEQGRVHHLGAFPALEDQMCVFAGAAGNASPDRLDALVWALTELMVERQSGLIDYYRQLAAARV